MKRAIEYCIQVYKSLAPRKTTNEYTAAQKRLTYKQQDSAHKAIAFKIDFRLFHHCCHSGKRIDIAKVESAKPGSNDKVTLDHAKLLREGKDALDRLLQAVMEQCVAYAMKAFVIQLDGFQGQMSSIHLDQLYCKILQNATLVFGKTIPEPQTGTTNRS
ncbi:hypothetical protein DFQ29_000762, partial [Apophysomyces sp. BC1021]